MIRKKPLAVIAVSLTAALTLAACSSGGGREETEGDGANAGTADTPSMTVAMITHQAPGDTFWDIIRKGAEAAAAKDNIQLEYSNDPDATKQAQLIQAAMDKKVDGIAVTDPNTPALGAAIKAAVAAGIPVTMSTPAATTHSAWVRSATSPGREGRRDRRRQEDRRRGWQEHHLRHPGAGPQQLEDRCGVSPRVPPAPRRARLRRRP